MIITGDCLSVLQKLESGFDCVVADPPYSSGGLHLNGRQQGLSKYLEKSTLKFFTGDNRDQKSWMLWQSLWISLAVGRSREGAYFFVFCDWRQLSATIDCVQAGGVTFRGVITWDKKNGRPAHKGYFKPQAEFIVWGSVGKLAKATHDGPFPGVITASVPSKKNHPTEKPVEVFAELFRCVPSGSQVLDPFAGSGSAGVAAQRMGHDYTGVEVDPYWADLAKERLSK